MPQEPTRPLYLLESSGILIDKQVAADIPTKIPQAKQAWAYSTGDARFNLWIYEFEGQDELNSAMFLVEEQLIPSGQALGFAQNGEFLLVVAPKFHWKKQRGDNQTVNQILEAFSGEVER